MSDFSETYAACQEKVRAVHAERERVAQEALQEVPGLRAEVVALQARVAIVETFVDYAGLYAEAEEALLRAANLLDVAAYTLSQIDGP